MNTYKYINPFTDYGFKLIFGTEANKDLLIDFLNAMFDFRYPITDVQLENTEQLPATERERKAIYDIYCTDSAGNRFIVEMQKGKITHFKDRALVYLTFPIMRMAPKGDWDFKLDEIYYLALLDFRYEPEKTAQLERLVRLMDQYGEVFYEKLQMKFIQLPAFDKKLVDLQSRYDQWIYFLQNLESMEVIPELFMTDTKFKKALTIAEIAKMKPEDALQYNLNRMEYIEIKGVADASFTDGQQASDAKWQPLLEQERREKEQERREKEQERREKEQAQKVAEQERERYILTLKRFIEAGFSKETVAEINKITVSELEELLAEESL